MKAKDVKKAIKKMSYGQVLKVEKMVAEVKARKTVDFIVEKCCR